WDCALFGNGRSGALVTSGAAPSLVGCVIRDNRDSGVIFERGGGGTLLDCTIADHSKAGVEVRDECDPRVERCHIEGAGAAGIECEEGGRGRFEDGFVARAGAAGVAVGKGAAPVLVRTNVEAALVGLSVGRGGDVTVEDCTLRGRAVAGASLQAGGGGRFLRSRVRGGRFGI